MFTEDSIQQLIKNEDLDMLVGDILEVNPDLGEWNNLTGWNHYCYVGETTAWARMEYILKYLELNTYRIQRDRLRSSIPRLVGYVMLLQLL